MFIKLKQKIKKYYAKILSKKFSGFGIFKFPSRKVLLGVFLMVMIFGGIFGGDGAVRAVEPPLNAPIGQCFGNEEFCQSAITNFCSPLSDDNPWYLKAIGVITVNFSALTTPTPQDTCRSSMVCRNDGPQENPYCIRPANATEFLGGIAKEGTLSGFDFIGKTIAMFFEKLANFVLAIIYIICWVLLHLVGIIIGLSASFFDATLTPTLYQNMFDSNMVARGWTIIRDICNMFFILILLVISLATILRIQTYKAQSLLLPLLIAAFLVNFSRPIVELAIDASQILMYQFVALMGGDFINSSVHQSLKNMVKIFTDAFGDWGILKSIFIEDLMNALSWVIAIMFALVFLIVLAAVYTAMALFMIIRLVALTILLILSPIGFFFNILPQTKSYASRYWSELSKYLIVGPIMIFFVYLAGELAINVPIELPAELTKIAQSGGASAGIFVALLGNLLYYVVIMVFLYASIWIARQLGIWGADKVEGMTVGKLAAGGAFLGGAVGGYMSRSLAKGKLPWQDTVRSVVRRVPGGKGLDKWVQGAAKKKMTTKSGKEYSVGRIKEQALGLLSPEAIKRGYSAHVADEEAEAYGISSGRMQDLIERTYVMGYKKPTHEELARQSRVADIQNKTKTKNPKILTNFVNTAIEEQDDEKVEANMELLAAGGDTSDIMELRGFENSRDGYDAFIRSLGKWMGENKAGRISSNVAELEKRKGNSSYYGQSDQDAKTEKFHYVDRDAAMKESNKKFKGNTPMEMKTVDAKTFTKVIKVEVKDERGNIVRDEDGNPKMENQYRLSDDGIMNLRDLTLEHVRWGLRGKPKDLEKLYEAFEREEAKVDDLKSEIGMFGFEFKEGIDEIFKETAKTKIVNKGLSDVEKKGRRTIEEEEEIEIEEEKKA